MEKFDELGERKHKKANGEDLLKKVEKTRQKFEEAMDNDFNTPLAVSALSSLIREINQYVKDHVEINAEVKEKITKIAKGLMEDILGIKIERQKPETDKLVADLMNLIIDMRQHLRERQDWKATDKIRTKLRALGLVLEDKPEGTEWKFKRKL